MREGAFFPREWMKLNQSELFSTFKSVHILKVHVPWIFFSRCVSLNGNRKGTFLGESFCQFNTCHLKFRTSASVWLVKQLLLKDGSSLFEEIVITKPCEVICFLQFYKIIIVLLCKFFENQLSIYANIKAWTIFT